MEKMTDLSRLQAGYSYREKGDYDSAIREFTSFLQDKPEDENILLELGKTYKMMNNCPQALEEFIRLIRINPYHKEAIRELGDTSRVSNNYEGAIKELSAAIKNSSQNEYAYIELSKIYQKMGSFDKALEELNKAYAINNNNPDTLVSFGQIYNAQGEHAEAIEKLKEAIKIDAHNKDAHAELAKIYQLQRKYSAAIDELKIAVNISPLDTKLRLNLIEVYTENDNYELSEKEGKETLKNVPAEPFTQDLILNEIEILQKKIILKSHVKRLWVTVTTRCNIKCRTCGLWSSPWEIPRKTADEVIRLFPYLDRVVWLGGEVFLYEYFDEMFTKACNYPNLKQQVITNGVILTEKWIEKIVNAGVELTISIDGITKEVYEYIRCGSNFEKLIKNIKLINELRQKCRSVTKMRLNAVIMKSNFHQFEGFLDFAKDLGFEQVSLMALHFDRDPQENILYSHADKKALEYITNTIPTIREKAKRYNIDLDILLPTLESKTKDPETGINVSSSKEQMLHCTMPWRYLFICDKGTVYLNGSCVKPIGNIYNNSIDEIWNSQEAQFYRESMLKNQFKDICRPECRTRWER